jgi:hypothetical protein
MNIFQYMAQNKNIITSENITEWLCSTGFLFPRNELELSRFEKIYSEQDDSITGEEVDPERIIKGTTYNSVIKLNTFSEETDYSNYKMVARNNSGLPKHILDKMKKNQENGKQGDANGSEENTTK